MKNRLGRSSQNSKKKRNNKKRANGKKRMSTMSLEEMILEADAAVEQSMDIPKAKTLYEMAIHRLEMDGQQQRPSFPCSSPPLPSDDGRSPPRPITGEIPTTHPSIPRKDPSGQLSLMVNLLTKLGETKVSLGDQDGARDDFDRAVRLLDDGDDDNDNEDEDDEERDDEREHDVIIDNDEDDDDDNGNDEDNDDDKNNQDTAFFDRMETKANLYLYIGQLSTEEEALRAYQRGVKQLESCVSLRERRSKASDKMRWTNGEEEHETEQQQRRQRQRQRQKRTDVLMESRQKLCQAYCTVAELYLTDLCFADNAERECERYVQKAMNIRQDSKTSSSSTTTITTPTTDFDGDDRDFPHFVDALQAMANLRLSQQEGGDEGDENEHRNANTNKNDRGRSRRDDATRHILAAYGKMRVGCEALAALVGLDRDHLPPNDSEDDDDHDEDDDHDGGLGNKRNDDVMEGEGGGGVRDRDGGGAVELIEVNAANHLPSFEFRCQTARILLECATSECIVASIQVLGSLLAENDEVIEIWYLLGRAFAAMCGDRDHPTGCSEAAEFYWERASDMLQKVREDHGEGMGRRRGDDEDDDDANAELESIKEQIKEIQERRRELRSKTNKNDDGGSSKNRDDGMDES